LTHVCSNVILNQLQIKTYQMKQLIQDIKKDTKFYQDLQDFEPTDYLFDTQTEYGYIEYCECGNRTMDESEFCKECI